MFCLINFTFSHSLPEFTENITNIKIYELSKSVPIIYFNGLLVPFLIEWSKRFALYLCEGEKKHQFTVEEYFSQLYKSQVDKYILCNEMFLSYGLYDEVIVAEGSSQLYLQKIKSEYRLGNYEYVIELGKEVLESDVPAKVLLETLYYLSSALYYKGDYEEAIEIAKKCVTIGWRIKDMDFYLNSMINFASIQYVYATTASDKNEREKLLDSAHRKYCIVQKRAEGVNIEAKATALWGLGDLERYRGNVHKALLLLQDALETLKKIGNAYAVIQLEKTIQIVQNECIGM